MTYALGTHLDIPMSDYVNDRLMDIATLNASAAHTITADCPYQAWFEHPRLNPNCPAANSDAADLGSVAHDMFLGGENKICVIEMKDWRTKEAREQRDAARERGLTPILSGKISQVKAMVEVANRFVARSAIKGAFDRGNAEATVLFEAGGVLCRCRPDWLGKDAVIHYKTTTGSANPERWIRSALDQNGYGLAAAFYKVGTGIDEQVFLVQSQCPPYTCSLVALAPAMMEINMFRVERALTLWSACMQKGKWPSYGSQIHFAEPAGWQLSEYETQSAEAKNEFTREELAGGVPL